MINKLNKHIVSAISTFLKDRKNFDIKHLRPSLINLRLSCRMLELNIKLSEEYYNYLLNTYDELDELINSLLINYSKFFRNPLLYEYIYSILLPEILKQKNRERGKRLRVWFVDCYSGEEPYSIAILIKEIIEKEK